MTTGPPRSMTVGVAFSCRRGAAPPPLPSRLVAGSILGGATPGVSGMAERDRSSAVPHAGPCFPPAAHGFQHPGPPDLRGPAGTRRRIDMSRSPEHLREATGPQSGAVDSDVVAAPSRRPNLSGDLETMLVEAPTFRRRIRGYDRLQVDNYVAWAETALLTARMEADDLLDRFGRCWAELEGVRQVLAHSPEGQQLARASDRIGSMRRRAADEAAEITATAAAEAERMRSEARADAEAERQKAQEVTERALA